MSGEKFTRRNLPHWYVPSASHFLTFRLTGTIPRQVLADFRDMKAQLLRRNKLRQSMARYRVAAHKQLFAAFDEYLDRNQDIRWLADPRVAAMIRGSLHFWNGQKYGLCAYCILPNHVHILLTPFGIEPSSNAERDRLEPGESADKNSPLSDILHSLKSYSAHEANRLLGRTGQFWQHESYDHWVRDDDELERIVAYINANPVKAGLATRPWEFPWCSAHDRYLHDGDESGWLDFGANTENTTSETLRNSAP